MKLIVTPLERPSRAKRQGLHYHICVPMDVLSKHVPTLVQYLVGQTAHLVGHCPMSYSYFPHCKINNLSDESGHFMTQLFATICCRRVYRNVQVKH